MHFHYIQLSGENKASEGAVPDVLEGSHPWVSGQMAARELKYLGAIRFLPFVVRHSFHCRMYVCVCLCACNTYVCNALARHNNIRTISHKLDLYGAGVLTAHAGRIHFMGDKKYYSPQLFIQILMIGFFKFLIVLIIESQISNEKSTLQIFHTYVHNTCSPCHAFGPLNDEQQ